MTSTSTRDLVSQPYKYGFVTEIETDKIAKGLSEEVVRLISSKKEEPDFLLQFRLKAFRHWLTLEEPDWAELGYPEIDYQDIVYYAAPKQQDKKASLDEVDPKLLETFDKLGIPLSEQKRLSNVAVDAVFDSVSIATTYKEKLAEHGVVFCSFSEAVKEHPELIERYLGSVVASNDNYFAALNSAVFSDGSFVFIPKGVECPMELSTYFRINSGDTGQFERTLIVAEEGPPSVTWRGALPRCSTPTNSMRLWSSWWPSTMHRSSTPRSRTGTPEMRTVLAASTTSSPNAASAAVPAVASAGPRWRPVRPSPGSTPVACCRVPIPPVSSIPLLSPTTAAGRHRHEDGPWGPRTRSTIVSKGISAGRSSNSYRGLVQMGPNAKGARNYSQCDSMLIGDQAAANTYPYIRSQQPQAAIEHEASTCRISEDQLFYLQSRGIGFEEAVSMMVSGFCRDVFNQLPMEFAAEADKLLALKLEGSVG